MNLLLDTNVLTRWVNSVDPFHEKTRQALRRVRTAGHVCVLVPQNLIEFWAVSTRPVSANGLGKSIEETVVEVNRLAPPLFRLLLDERGIFGEWRTLVEKYRVQGKTTHDARLVAAMMRHGVSHLLTFNVGDFARYGEITAVHPDEVIAGQALGPVA